MHQPAFSLTACRLADRIFIHEPARREIHYHAPFCSEACGCHCRTMLDSHGGGLRWTNQPSSPVDDGSGSALLYG